MHVDGGHRQKPIDFQWRHFQNGRLVAILPDRRQAIIWTNAGILLIETLRTNFNEILIEIHTFSFKNIHLKMASGKWRPFCLGLNVLKHLKSLLPQVTWVLQSMALCKTAVTPVELLQSCTKPLRCLKSPSGRFFFSSLFRLCGTKPLPKPMLTYHDRDPLTSIPGRIKFIWIHLSHLNSLRPSDAYMRWLTKHHWFR